MGQKIKTNNILETLFDIATEEVTHYLWFLQEWEDPELNLGDRCMLHQIICRQTGSMKMAAEIEKRLGKKGEGEYVKYFKKFQKKLQRADDLFDEIINKDWDMRISTALPLTQEGSDPESEKFMVCPNRESQEDALNWYEKAIVLYGLWDNTSRDMSYDSSTELHLLLCSHCLREVLSLRSAMHQIPEEIEYNPPPQEVMDAIKEEWYKGDRNKAQRMQIKAIIEAYSSSKRRTNEP